MKLALLVPVVLAMLMATSAHGKSEKANPAAPGQSKAQSVAGANGKGTDKVNPKGEKPSDGGTPTAPDAVSDQNGALSAVQSGAALPLSTVTAAAIAQWGGKAIDAKLILIRGQRVYQLTLLSDDGVSRKVYYSARSGKPLQVK